MNSKRKIAKINSNNTGLLFLHLSEYNNNQIKMPANRFQTKEKSLFYCANRFGILRTLALCFIGMKKQMK